MTTSASLDRDANRLAIPSGVPFLTSKTKTYTGAAGLGEVGAATLFTVTGDVILEVFATCVLDLAGATATLAVGTSAQATGIINTTTATAIDTGFAWTTQSTNPVGRIGTAPVLVRSQNIIETVATANITGGTLNYYCFWRPLSSTGNVVAA
jgi:hypothetical protein